MAADKRFVQVLVLSRTIEPLGRKRYWPIYEACERHGLPLGIHNGGWGGHPMTPAGFPSYYIEDTAAMATRLPGAGHEPAGGGRAHALPGAARACSSRAASPGCPRSCGGSTGRGGGCGPRRRCSTARRRSSIRERFYVSTQPMEETERPEQFLELLEQLGMDDRIMFSTDYPALGLRRARHGAAGAACRPACAAQDPARQRRAPVRPRRARRRRWLGSSSAPWRSSRLAAHRRGRGPLDRRLQRRRGVPRDPQPLPAPGRAAVRGRQLGAMTSDGPGDYRYEPPRRDDPLPVARVGVRPAHGRVVVRPRAQAGALATRCEVVDAAELGDAIRRGPGLVRGPVHRGDRAGRGRGAAGRGRRRAAERRRQGAAAYALRPGSTEVSRRAFEATPPASRCRGRARAIARRRGRGA